MTDLKVDRKAYVRRLQKDKIERYDRAITDRRQGTWSAAEDAIVLLDDLLIVEKVAILQRSTASITTRRKWLKRATTGNCLVCGELFRNINLKRKYCSPACRGVRQIKSHCKYGHEIAVVGRYTNRACKECNSVRSRESRSRKRREAAQARASESDL